MIVPIFTLMMLLIIDTLEKEVKVLKEEFLKLTKNKNSRINEKIEILEKEVIFLMYEINQLNIKLRKPELLPEDLNSKSKIITENKTSYQS